MVAAANRVESLGVAGECIPSGVIMHAMRNGLRVVAVSGFASNVGKTTVACRLLERLPGWEAIKVTKGHYRSCGKDPHACCVSHLLSDAPLVLSGRERTYAPGKDTGRYWDAGASNVHWVVATKDRVADGVREALGRVADAAPGVVVEGTGFLVSVPVDYAVMVAGPEFAEIKASAAAVFRSACSLFLSRVEPDDEAAVERVRSLLRGRRVDVPLPPVLYERDLPRLAAEAAGAVVL
jgi:molybdopterin-guanine dinucleotide biosynthesis protein